MDLSRPASNCNWSERQGPNLIWMIFIFLGTAALFARAGERRGEDEELNAASQPA